MTPICFVSSSREFLFRHFSPAIDAAKASGADVIAYVPAGLRDDRVATDGVTVITAPTARDGNSFWALIRETFWFARALRRQRPAIVVAYSLRMCTLVALLQPLLGSSRFVLGITGVGFIGIAESLRLRIARRIVFAILRNTSRARTHFIFENASDPAMLGISEARGHRLSILMGAGIDPNEFRPTELPKGPPFRFATVSRLIWSKGIDIAAEAIASLAQQGYPVELHIYGAPDPANPRPIDPASLASLPGVRYHGFSDRIANVWHNYHAGIFTSRGGEGLPRSLLEAAACGRPCIVTDVPGCSDFIRNDVEGYVVPIDSQQALRDAILRTVGDPARLSRLGRAAKERALRTSTLAITEAKYDEIFRSVLGQPVRRSSDPLRLDAARPVDTHYGRRAI